MVSCVAAGFEIWYLLHSISTVSELSLLFDWINSGFYVGNRLWWKLSMQKLVFMRFMSARNLVFIIRWQPLLLTVYVTLSPRQLQNVKCISLNLYSIHTVPRSVVAVISSHLWCLGMTHHRWAANSRCIPDELPGWRNWTSQAYRRIA